MKNFREMPFVRVLVLALVFVVCFGVFGVDGAFARRELHNGGEGDPEDGMDIVGGGGGDGSVGEENKSPEQIVISHGLFVSDICFVGPLFDEITVPMDGVHLLSTNNHSFVFVVFKDFGLIRRGK